MLDLLSFCRYVLPTRFASWCFVRAVWRVMMSNSGSVYAHFKLLKNESRGNFIDFARSLMTLRFDDGGGNTATQLLTRLLRTVYLTQPIVKDDFGRHIKNADEGFARHPDFTCGDELAAKFRAETVDGNLS